MIPTFGGRVYRVICTVCSCEYKALFDDCQGWGCCAHTELRADSRRVISAGFGSVFDMDNFSIVSPKIEGSSVLCDLCLIEWMRYGDIVYWRGDASAKPDPESILYYAIGVAIGQWSW